MFFKAIQHIITKLDFDFQLVISRKCIINPMLSGVSKTSRIRNTDKFDMCHECMVFKMLKGI